MSFNAIKYYVFLYKSLSRIMAHKSHVIYACYKKYASKLVNVNLRQITFLRGYIHPNEQSVMFIS